MNAAAPFLLLPMATEIQQLSSDLDAFFADFECTFTHSSTSYTGTMSALSKKRNLEEGGFFPEFDANIELKASDFSSAPIAGQKITMTSCFDTVLNGTVFRIESVEHPDGAAIRLAVTSLTQ